MIDNEAVKEAVERLKDTEGSEVNVKSLRILINTAKAVLSASSEMPEKRLLKQDLYNKCIICGADDGLHQADTDKCPRNGVEAHCNKKQEWDETIFTPYDISPIVSYNEAIDQCTLVHLRIVAELEEKVRLLVKELGQKDAEIRMNNELLGNKNKEIDSLKQRNAELEKELKHSKNCFEKINHQCRVDGDIAQNWFVEKNELFKKHTTLVKRLKEVVKQPSVLPQALTTLLEKL